MPEFQGLVLHGTVKGLGRIKRFDNGDEVRQVFVDTGRMFPESVSVPRLVADGLVVGEVVGLPVYARGPEGRRVYLRYSRD